MKRPDAPVYVALEGGTAGVQLYAVGRDRHARLVETFLSPLGDAPRFFEGLTLSGGARPTTCVSWVGQSEQGGQTIGQLWCYPFGDTKGFRVPDRGTPTGTVQLRPDGKGVMWVSERDSSGDSEELVVADLSVGGPGRVHRYHLSNVSVPQPTIGCSTRLGGIAWVSDRSVVITCLRQDSQGSQVLLQSLDGSSASFQVTHEPPFVSYEVAGTDGSGLLAIERAECRPHCDTVIPATRAVRFDLRTRKVTTVIARAAPGRWVRFVSGGPRAWLYITDSGEDPRVYLRFAGEPKGALVSGLALTDGQVIAQP